MNAVIVSGGLLNQPVDVIVSAWNRNAVPWWVLNPKGVAGTGGDSRALDGRGIRTAEVHGRGAAGAVRRGGIDGARPAGRGLTLGQIGGAAKKGAPWIR